MYYPQLHPKPGDMLLASHDAGWPTTVTDHVAYVDAGETSIAIEFVQGDGLGARDDNHHSNDTFVAKVNGERQPIHIDFISNVMGLADRVNYIR